MYLEYFGLQRLPFTISPDPDFLYPSPGHQEALAHLSYALTDQGGLICLTGEVGTGKTTLCRALMASVPEGDHIAYIFNPQLSPSELLESLCDELHIQYASGLSLRELYRVLYMGLLKFYANNQRVICVIDEAQVMSPALLEQVRLLTNLETNTEKLLTLVLVGQTELKDILERHELRQMNQRITARYHLEHLDLNETAAYLAHRIQCAGGGRMLFDQAAIKVIWQNSMGVPRLINSMADRALLGAYSANQPYADATIARRAVIEVSGAERKPAKIPKKRSPTQAAASRNAASGESRPLLLPIIVVLLLILVLVLTGWVGFRLWPGADDAPETQTGTGSAALPSVAMTADSRSADQKSRAFLELAAAQGLDASDCSDLQGTGWSCLDVQWPLNEIRSFAQPALTLSGGDWQVLSPAVRRYDGRAILLWQPPVGYDGLVRPGDQSPVVAWVRQQLDANWGQDWTSIGPSGVRVEMDPKFYDPLLQKAVVDFQLQNALDPDGILGPRTLLHLMKEG